MFKVGLTGGIGSGKSTVAELFAQHGVTIIDADHAARAVVAPGSDALARIAAAFGSEVLSADGTLDRAALRSIVFADPERRHLLERILHPVIIARMHAEAEHAAPPYCILVMPLLFEAGQAEAVDRILVVDCPAELQRQRAMSRDAASAQEVEAIMAAQIPRPQRLKGADDVIRNDGNMQHLETQVKALHRRYMAMASE